MCCCHDSPGFFIYLVSKPLLAADPVSFFKTDEVLEVNGLMGQKTWVYRGGWEVCGAQKRT